MTTENTPTAPGIMTDTAAPSPEFFNKQSLQDRMALYIEAMAPGKPLSPEDGAHQQLSLWRNIKFVLDKKGSEFISLWSELLKIVCEHRHGVFSESHVFRFMDTVRMTSNERRDFERIILLMRGTCDPKMRALSLRQINLKVTLSGFQEDLRQRIHEYYTL